MVQEIYESVHTTPSSYTLVQTLFLIKVTTNQGVRGSSPSERTNKIKGLALVCDQKAKLL